MKNFYIWFKYRLKAYIRSKLIIKKGGARNYSRWIRSYAGKNILSCDEGNKYIKNKILEGKPFLAARFGSTELLNMQTYDFGAYGKFDINYRFDQLCKWSGFFPNNIELCGKFVDLMKESCKSINFLAVWFNPFEDYYIKKYMNKDIQQTYLLDYEPWAGNVHWSSALKGKKVLVIHPFENTIKMQYQKREKLFKNSDILPEFELKTLKAVQTLAGTKDDRFNNWFEALEYMFNEAMKIDFDIAIIGCGAYGLPLAAKIKNTGKQVIHLGGATQLLFGIKGKRWEECSEFEYVKKWFNEEWVYPSEGDRIKDGEKVEGACYW